MPGDEDPDGGEFGRLRRELAAVDLERRRLRSELEAIRSSALGRLIGPARTVSAIVERYARRLGGDRVGAWLERRRGSRSSPRRPPPQLSGSELGWLARSRLRRRQAVWAPPAAPRRGAWLTPILLDYFGRDGSTATMALLGTSPEIVIDDKYPYERRYFTYLWRWARLPSRTDWPAALWGKDDVVSIAQDSAQQMLGPPPWLPRPLLDPRGAGEPISNRLFELAWGELSARSAKRERSPHVPGGAPRYYAEKHVNTWQVDLRELPPIRLLVLLRDPRDSYASIRSFEAREPATSFGIHDAWIGADRLDGIIERNRQRLRWIAGLLDAGEVPVIRYEELRANPDAVARMLERHLDVALTPGAIPATELAARHSTSGEDGSGRWRRDLDPATAERFTRELESELAAVGLDAD